MREEGIRLVWEEAINRNLLHADDHRCIADVLLNNGPRLHVRLKRIGTSVGRLYDDLHSATNEFTDVQGGEWGTTFPDGGIFTADSYKEVENNL